MACRACAEEACASGGVGSRVALDFEKLETAGWTVEQREKSLVFFSPFPEKKRFKSSKDVADYLKSCGEFVSFVRCYCGTSAMSPSRSSESDEDYRPDTEEEALSSVFGDTPVKNDGLGKSSDAPSPKRLVWQCLRTIFIRFFIPCDARSISNSSFTFTSSLCLRVLKLLTGYRPCSGSLYYFPSKFPSVLRGNHTRGIRALSPKCIYHIYQKLNIRFTMGILV